MKINSLINGYFERKLSPITTITEIMSNKIMLVERLKTHKDKDKKTKMLLTLRITFFINITKTPILNHQNILTVMISWS